MRADGSDDFESLRTRIPGQQSELQGLLRHISHIVGVRGALIVTPGGFVLASTLADDLNDVVAAAGLELYDSAQAVVRNGCFGHSRLHQAFGRTSQGWLHVADFGGGLVISVTATNELKCLIALAMRVTKLVT
jgi:predicted regulator of Ras-like GTPase activity (Roadblock/LC7/MglB family)